METLGDWNCVPDVTLDVQSANPLAYANVGAALLGDITAGVGLVDFRREQLGDEKEPTRRGTHTAHEGAPATAIATLYAALAI